MPFRKIVLSLAVLLLASASVALAQGTYTQIDYPGAPGTRIQGIDTAGAVVGWYTDASGLDHGFLLSGGNYTTIDYPGSYATALYGINDLGQFAGSTYDPYGGFLYDSQTKTFTAIGCDPVWATYTFAGAINNAGTVVGGTVGQRGFGFELPIGSSTCRQIAGPRGSLSSGVTAISAKGHLIVPVSGLSYTYFLYNLGKYHGLTIPNAPSFAVAGINPKGTAFVGTYQPSAGIYVGFLYQNQVLTTLQFPGAADTFATGVNGAGEVVGYFENSGAGSHGFTWTPPADAAKK